MTKLIFIFLAALSFTLPEGLDTGKATKAVLPLISAHRGASRLAPENTIAAFEKAIQAGADFIEVDVRTTSDGEQVIVHDKSLQRTAGLSALVSETNYTTIKGLSAGNWFNAKFKDEKVPALEQVCALVYSRNRTRKDKIMLYVDCKAIDPAKVVSTLNKHELLRSAVFYGDLQTLKSIGQSFAAARLMPPFPGITPSDDLLKSLKPYAYDVPFAELDEKVIAYIHSKGIKVFSDLLEEYDNPDAYRKAVQLGVDLIQTDDVDAVRKVYLEFQTHEK